MHKRLAFHQFAFSENILTGTNGDDLFTVSEDGLEGSSFNGSEGIDTLQLSGGGTFDLSKPLIFQGIERIVGSEHNDIISLTAERFGGVTTIDGGADPALAWDVLRIEGEAFDLRGKSITNIDRIETRTNGAVLTTDSRSMALLASGYVSQNDHLVLVGEALTAAQIRVLHQRGIDKITDANGVHIDAAPMLAGISGDRSAIEAGETLFLDVSHDASISDDGRIGALNVLVTKDFHEGDWLGIDTSGPVSLSAGVEVGSTVSVHGIELGMIWGAGGPKIEIAFNQNATPASVQEILRALTYTTSATAPLSSKHREISIEVSDEGGRIAQKSVGVDQYINEAPSAIKLTQATVLESAPNGTQVGLLSATDPNPNETFSFALVDNASGRFALDGNRLIVADGAKLDYEAEESHRVTLRVTDAGQLSCEQTFTIVLQDIKDTTTGSTGDGEVIVADPGRDTLMGGRGNDTLVGGSGSDKLSGGRGNDLIYGKRGNDTLIGGVGRDKFVFDTKLDKKKNVDRMTDFSVTDDTIYLDNAIFKKLGKSGSLKKPIKLQKKMFWKGEEAHDADDRVIYNPKNGALYYDVDGTGSGAAIKIATLPKGIKAISHHDIFLI